MTTDHGHKQEKQHLIVPVREGSRDHTGDIARSSTYDAIMPPPPNNDMSSTELTNFLGIHFSFMIVCLCIGGFLACLDISICFTIMTQIGTEFKHSNLATWIHSAFALFSMTGSPISSKLSDMFGRKPILLTITLLFLVGSAGCGFSQSLPQLVFFRGLSGLGGGGLMLMSNVITHDMVPLKYRGRYQSYINSMSSLGIAIGSPIGGFLTDWLGWRYCFKINILPLLFNMYIYTFHLKNYRLPGMDAEISLRDRIKSIDFGGSLICFMANASLCTVLILGGNTHEWSDPFILSVLALTIGSFVSFGLWETYVARNPLLAPHLLANRFVVLGCVGLGLICMISGGSNVSLPQFFMGVLGFSTRKTGLCVMVNTLGITVGSFTGGRIMRFSGRFYKLAVAVATTLACACMLMHFWMLQKISVIAGIILWTLVGCTIGFFTVTLNVTIPTSVPRTDIASTFSMLQMGRSMGYMSGVAAASSVTQAKLKILLHERLNGPDAEQLIQFIRKSLCDLHTLSPEIQAIVVDVLSISLSKAYILLTALAVCAVLVFFSMKSKVTDRSN